MLRGERLDRPTYSFLRTITDEGNTAICSRGVHEIYECEVVQKTISTLGMPDSIAREPQLLKSVKHERIIEVWEAQWDPEYKDQQAITFITPYMAGGSIHTALTEGERFSVRQVVQIACDMLVALDVLHDQHQILHRDVKPGNIFLEGDRRRALLGDLGSAARMGDEDRGADAHAGSPLYRSPEALSTGRVTARSDLYSLGVTMIEMLNGPFPYEMLDRDDIDNRLASGRRPLVDRKYKLAPWVPKPLATFIRGLVNVDPDKRPGDAATALRTLRDLRLVDWRPTSGEDLVGKWVGYWPPQERRQRQRMIEVETTVVERGVNKGRIAATARWRATNGKWRNYARLNARLDATPEALAAYFNEVDRAAQAAPTR